MNQSILETVKQSGQRSEMEVRKEMNTHTTDQKVVLSCIERTVERITHTSVSELRNRSLEDQRVSIEQKHRHPMRFVSRYPTIGRGNIMRDRTKSHAEIEEIVDQVLK